MQITGKRIFKIGWGSVDGYATIRNYQNLVVMCFD
jgi:hypothetical protein